MFLINIKIIIPLALVGFVMIIANKVCPSTSYPTRTHGIINLLLTITGGYNNISPLTSPVRIPIAAVTNHRTSSWPQSD